jgi:DMSO reductase anchor subunit
MANLGTPCAYKMIYSIINKVPEENAMKTKITNFLIPVLGGSATSAFAADGAAQSSGGPLVWFFVGFVALVVVVQVIPAAILLYSMIRAIFSPSEAAKLASVTRANK